MSRIRLPIRTTLLIIIGFLTILIAGQAVFRLYVSLSDHSDARALKQVALNVNTIFDGEKFLSLERASSVAAIAGPTATGASLREEIRKDRMQADKIIEAAYAMRGSSENESELMAQKDRVRKSHIELNKRRQQLDAMLERPNGLVDRDTLALAFLDASSRLIIDLHDYIDVYSRPYMTLNADVSRQIRYSHVIWNITEYAGREYALIGKLIVENKYASPEMQEQLAVWHGRISYAWEIAQNGISNNPVLEEIRPLMEEAETHYFMTFDQIKEIFQRPQRNAGRATYPISVQMWLEMASQAVDSMHAMNDGVLKINQVYVDRMRKKAEQSILVCIFLLISALLLSMWSWRVVNNRVIKPVNLMVDALDKATQGEHTALPAYLYGYDEIGKLANVLTVLHENSRQLLLERDRAQAANIAKSEFLANMSHEIRTPMNVILGLSNILHRTSLTDKQKEFVTTLHLSAESLLSIINDLLDFSKIETKSFELEQISFNLADLVNEVTNLLNVKLQEKGLRLETDVADVKTQAFIGDPTRIKQIITNIYGNAIKFTEKGKIRISVTSKPRPLSTFDDVAITIADTGIGIPIDKLDHIFEKFTQVDSTISRKYGGTGLGLAITKAFVEMMNGTIVVESRDGQGTSFTLNIPLSPSTQPVLQANLGLPRQDARVEATGACVLLVEDYQPNALVAGEYLKQFGFDYDVAENGYQALEKIRAKNYHAVLMDIQMQGLDGYRTTEAVRAYEKENRIRRIKIIGMTAHALVGDREKCIAAGMDDYISKPFKAEDLREKLAS